jgi:hypothetical protein
MGNNFLTTVFSAGVFGLLLADTDMQNMPLVPFVFIWLTVIATTCIFVVGMIYEHSERRQMRARHSKLHDDWQHSYNMLFFDMNKRLNEAQQRIDELSLQLAQAPEIQTPSVAPIDDYFDRMTRPRRFLNPETSETSA